MTPVFANTPQVSSQWLYSIYGTDPDLSDLVELFVDEMPGRVRSLLEHAQRGEWADVSRLAHQLKGAAGSYGFPQITPVAQQLERAARHGHDDHEVRAHLDALVTLCKACRAGAPQ